MSWLRSLKGKEPVLPSSAGRGNLGPAADAPPSWTPAPQQPHKLGLFNEATDDEFESAELYCSRYPLERPRLLPSDVVDRINSEGCRVWSIEIPRSDRFVGKAVDGGEKGKPGVCRVTTGKRCRDTCLFSNLPLLAGLYEIQGKTGVYYEVLVKKMDGIIAIGMLNLVLTQTCIAAHTVDHIGSACRPYPDWRFPGWNRSSVGLHLDDMRKFFEDPDGGMDYDPILTRFSCGDTIGFGYDFTASSVFYTYNGIRLPDAFGGVYVPRNQYDVYAAIGVEGACEFEVNFGAELFRWKEGNEWAWRVEGHVGILSGTSGRFAEGDELPAYEAVSRRR